MRGVVPGLVALALLSTPIVLLAYLGSSSAPGLAMQDARARPENKAFFDWIDQPHEFTPPDEAAFAPLPHQTWNGLPRRTARGGNVRTDHAIDIEVDRTYGKALEAHFGQARDQVRRAPRSEVQEALMQDEIERVFALHGLVMDYENGMQRPDYDWIVDHSLDRIRPVAEAVIRAVEGTLEVSTRRKVEALTSYVQGAIPYERIKGLEDGKDRHELRTPLEVLFEGGDCDSKSLLLATLLRAVEPSLPVALVRVVFTGETGTGEVIEPPEDCTINHAVVGVGLDPVGGETTLPARASGRGFILIEAAHDQTAQGLVDEGLKRYLEHEDCIEVLPLD